MKFYSCPKSKYFIISCRVIACDLASFPIKEHDCLLRNFEPCNNLLCSLMTLTPHPVCRIISDILDEVVMQGAELRNRVVNDEIDYFLLKSILAEYDRPREKISTLLKSGVLIRVKKGLYVFGKGYSRKAISKEVLANLIYGPSAISLTYALSFYGLIPERVVAITSITNKKNKTFDTPLGRFTYQYVHPDKYAIGITQLELDETHNILIATPEKALADQIVLVSTNLQINTDKDSKEFLFDDLRLDKNILSKFNLKLFNNIAKVYDNKNLNKIADFLDKRRK